MGNRNRKFTREGLIRFSAVMALCALVVCGCGVKPEDQSLTVEEMTESTEDVVSLSDVRPPAFREDFATVESGSDSMVASWGDSDGVSACFVWNESGYPGFGYPIVVEGYNRLHGSQIVSVVVQWGTFNYRFTKSGTAYDENHSLIDSTTGKEIVNWGRLGEVLVVWDPMSKIYWEYEFTDGTRITA